MSDKKGDLINRLNKEYEELEKVWLNLPQKDLIDLARTIAITQTGLAYIQNNIEEDLSRLEAYDEMDNVLESFVIFQQGSANGAITEETIEEFEEEALDN